jgi:two-component system sensor histidine kinase/response regulator
LANFSNTVFLPIAAAGAPPHELPRQQPPPDHWEQGVHLEALANLAHELRSPVQALLGYLDILRDELGDVLNSRHKHIFERANANAHDLAQTVENVMDFSVADAMAEATDQEDIYLHELIAELAPALEAANDSKGLQIRYDLESAPGVFRSRRRPIKSILLNLAVNAIKFTEKGSVTIAIREAVSPEAGPAVELSVSDTGPGIDAEMVARAFKLCAQLSNSSVRRHRGMGLGLAVVRRNAIALGATIAVNSALRQGSVFTVTIPIAESPVTHPPSFHA